MFTKRLNMDTVMAISTDQIALELKKIKASTFKQAQVIEHTKPIAQLVTELQTTITLSELLPIFSKHLAKLVAHSGLIFKHQELSIDELYGKRTNHSCEYALSIESTHLGKLTLMRRKRFSETELETIENLLGCLMHPLKNSLLYFKAIQQAHTDPLTGALNRSTLSSVFQKETAQSKRQNTDLTLLMIDIDRFKAINDNYGHAAGDTVLKELTICIHQTIRESDHLFRLGGEEFAVLLHPTDPAGAMLLAERLRGTIQALKTTHADNELNFTVSIGLSRYHEGDSLECTMQRADKALYEAKETGRNKVVSA